MQRMITSALALAALGLLCASCASEPSHHGHGGRGRFAHAQGAERPSVIVRPGALWLIDLDADHDLVVTKAELDAGARAMFDRADANHDGFLSPLEFDALAQAHMGTAESTPGRISFDANGDGKISPDEFAAGLDALFDRFDANHDATVTRAELIESLEAPGAGAKTAAPGENPAGGRGRRRGGY